MNNIIEKMVRDTTEIEDKKYVDEMVASGELPSKHSLALLSLINERRWLQKALPQASIPHETLQNIVYKQGQEPQLMRLLENQDRFDELKIKHIEDILEVMGEIGADILFNELDTTKTRPEVHEVYKTIMKVWNLATQRVPIFDSQKPIPVGLVEEKE